MKIYKTTDGRAFKRASKELQDNFRIFDDPQCTKEISWYVDDEEE